MHRISGLRSRSCTSSTPICGSSGIPGPRSGRLRTPGARRCGGVPPLPDSRQTGPRCTQVPQALDRRQRGLERESVRAPGRARGRKSHRALEHVAEPPRAGPPVAWPQSGHKRPCRYPHSHAGRPSRIEERSHFPPPPVHRRHPPRTPWRFKSSHPHSHVRVVSAPSRHTKSEWSCAPWPPFSRSSRYMKASMANTAMTTSTKGTVRAATNKRLFRRRMPTKPPAKTVANGRAASRSQGATGITSVWQSVSPVEPGGVSYTSSPHDAMPPTNQSRTEAGIARIVNAAHRPHAPRQPLTSEESAGQRPFLSRRGRDDRRLTVFRVARKIPCHSRV